MNPFRTALYAGMGGLGPIIFWTISQIVVGHAYYSHQEIFTLGSDTVWLIQAIILAFLAPLFAAQVNRTPALCSLVLFTLLPLPFIVVAWLAGAGNEDIVLRNTIILVILGSSLFLLTDTLKRAFNKPQTAAIIQVTIQIIIATSIWHYRDLWSGVIN